MDELLQSQMNLQDKERAYFSQGINESMIIMITMIMIIKDFSFS